MDILQPLMPRDLSKFSNQDLLKHIEETNKKDLAMAIAIVRKWRVRIKERKLELPRMRLKKGETYEDVFSKGLLAAIHMFFSALEEQLYAEGCDTENGAVLSFRRVSHDVVARWEVGMHKDLDEVAELFIHRASLAGPGFTRLDSDELDLVGEVFFEELLAGNVETSGLTKDPAPVEGGIGLRWSPPVIGQAW